MLSSDTIPRLVTDPDGLDFASLRAQAIASAQALSGKIWTDYNLHDPGVTILEQLCFGLTELAYQAGAPVADFIANDKGHINYTDLALLKPHEAFPSSAVTPADYCKLLLDQVPELERVEFLPLSRADGVYSGCYKVVIKVLSPLTGAALNEEQKADIKRRVASVYAGQRNLAEDLAQIELEETRPCFLAGLVETDGSRMVAEVYADILFQTARKLSSDISILRYEDAVVQHHELADLFTGPLTQHGYIENTQFEARSTVKVMEELNGVVAQIPGVKKVHSLRLVDALNVELNSAQLTQERYHLKYPEAGEPLLAIDFNASKTSSDKDFTQTSRKQAPKLMLDARRYLQKLEFAYRAFRTNKASASKFYALPQAQPRLALAYYSVQHHFPHVYGINSAGVPAHASPLRKAYAQQLKAYLYPFEQLLANFLALLQQLQTLFSLNATSAYSYFSEYLDNHHIPHIESVYGPEAVTAAEVQQVLGRYDNAVDRKNRALDSLLALYGEEYPQEGLLSFNYYHQRAPGYWCIDNKINYLRHIAELSSRRAAGFNLQQPHWNSTAAGSFHKKIAILLGLKHFDRIGSLSQVFTARNIHWTSDAALTKAAKPVDGAGLQPIPSLSDKQYSDLQRWRYQSAKPLSISPKLLVYGTHLDAYGLHRAGNQTEVYIQIPEQPPILLSQFARRDQALLYAHKFNKIIIDVNLDAEGFFIVEHLLLRPSAAALATEAGDFYEQQLSFVFPKWGARFSNPAFQRYAQKVICHQLPAHLFANFIWLEQESVTAFETIYSHWLECLHTHAQTSQAATALDAAAERLSSWLKQQETSRDYWV